MTMISIQFKYLFSLKLLTAHDNRLKLEIQIAIRMQLVGPLVFVFLYLIIYSLSL